MYLLHVRYDSVWRLTSSYRMPYAHNKFLPIDNRRTFKHAFLFLRVWPGALSTCHTRGVPLCCLTCIHAMGSRFGAQDRKPCKQWTSALFLPNPFIQDLFLWHTSQEIVKKDLYPLSQGLWSLSGMPSVRPGAGRGHCVRACQRSSCVEERRP